MGLEEEKLNDANLVVEEIENTEVIEPNEISVELYNLRSNKSEKLINNSDTTDYQKGINSFYRFGFNEKVWVSDIYVKTEKYYKLDKFDFSWFLGDKTQEIKVSNYNDYFIVTINDFIDGFSFKPPKKLYAKPRLISISVNGFTQSEFADACETVANLESFKQSILDKSTSIIEQAENANTSIEELQARIEEKQSEYTEVKEDVNQLEKNKTELNERLRLLGSKESDLSTRIESLDDSIDGKRREQESLNSSIESRRLELAKLKEDINMFPSEIAGFVNEGEKALNKYYWLSAIPMVVIAAVVYSLFSGAVDLTTVLNKNEKVDILTIMLTRLPYVTVSAMLITACYQLIKYFVGQMVNINQQRLNLNKISIIANDVSIASSAGIDMDESEKYHARTKLKMELLKEHLKEEISQDYEYDENFQVTSRPEVSEEEQSTE